MARRSRKLRAVTHHYWPGNTPEEIRAFNERYNFNLDELLAEIERTASHILKAANFPKTLKPPFSPPDVILKQQIEERGFDWESREGYAMRVMYQTWLVRTALPRPDAVALHAMELGSLITQATMHGHWERGLSVLLGGRKGAEHWASLRNVRGKRTRYTDSTRMNAQRAAVMKTPIEPFARQTKVNARTVRRIITGH